MFTAGVVVQACGQAEQRAPDHLPSDAAVSAPGPEPARTDAIASAVVPGFEGGLAVVHFPESQLARFFSATTNHGGDLVASYPSEAMLRIIRPDGSWSECKVDPGLGGGPRQVGTQPNGYWATGSSMLDVLVMDADCRRTDFITLHVPSGGGAFRGARVRGIAADRTVLAEPVETYGSLLTESAIGDAHDRLSDPLRGPRTPAVPLWRIDPVGGTVRNVVERSIQNYLGLLVGPDEDLPIGRRSRPFQQPFGDSPLFVVGPHSQYVVLVDRRVGERSTGGRFVVHWLNHVGDTLRSRAYSYDGIPVQLAWVETETMQRAATLTTHPSGPAIVQAALFVPWALPPVTSVRVGPTGWVWVERESVPEARCRHWQVLDVQGTVRAELDLPVDMHVAAVHETTAWARITNDSGGRELVHISIPADAGEQGRWTRCG